MEGDIGEREPALQTLSGSEAGMDSGMKECLGSGVAFIISAKSYD